VTQTPASTPPPPPAPQQTVMNPPVVPVAVMPPQPTSGYAIASLVLGVLSLVTCTIYALPPFLFSPLAIGFAIAGKRQVKRGEAGGSSQGLATAGFVTGLIGLILSAGIWLIIIGTFVVAAIAAAASQP